MNLIHIQFKITNKGNNRSILGVVPDSGTGELVGLSAKMDIIIKDGQHLYELEYELS
jgi:hypothetical protein